MPQKEEKNKGGRPSKLTEKWLKTAEEVLNEEGNALLTDEELLFLINEKADNKEETITQTTYTNWKNKVKNNKELDEIGKRFLALIKKTLIVEKRNLLKEVREGGNNWQSRAWIIERKFEEWNIKHKQEVEMPEVTKELKETREQLKKIFE